MDGGLVGGRGEQKNWKTKKTGKNLKKPNREKKRIKPIRILKKPTGGSVSVL
jgi:hypothetical protein